MESRDSISPETKESNEKKPAVSQAMLDRLALRHAAVVQKWNCNFALDLHLPEEAEPAPETPKD